MIVTLVGMSNIGKSHLAGRFATELGFKSIICDKLIEDKLKVELDLLGFSGDGSVSKWLGQPYAKGYHEASNRLLECEREVMVNLIKRLTQYKESKKVVVDTSGSVIYLDKKILDGLKRLSKIVYLEAPTMEKSDLFKLYTENPKPVIWGNIYNKSDSESEYDSLARSYSELVQYRAAQYKKMADISIPYEIHRLSKIDLNDLMARLV